MQNLQENALYNFFHNMDHFEEALIIKVPGI